MNGKVRKVWDAVTTVLVAAVAIMAVLLAGGRLVGLQAFAVRSGSMEPEYPVGSLIYVQRTDRSGINPGDPITFMLNEHTAATHRVVEIIQQDGGICYRTKGDANTSADIEPVQEENVIGKPVFMVPYLGYAASYIQTPSGRLCSCAGGAILLILIFVPELFTDRRKAPGASRQSKAGSAGQRSWGNAEEASHISSKEVF